MRNHEPPLKPWSSIVKLPQHGHWGRVRQPPFLGLARELLHPGTRPDLPAGLRRLKLSRVRRIARELLATAKAQRRAPEELLRTLLADGLEARDASKARTRMKAVTFPVIKKLKEIDVAASSIPQPTFDYLASLESIRAAENLCLVGPAETGTSHTRVARGVATADAGHKVHEFTAAALVNTLYEGWPPTPPSGH